MEPITETESHNELKSSSSIRQWLSPSHLKMLNSFLHSLTITSSRSTSSRATSKKPDRLDRVLQTIHLCRHFIETTPWQTPAELLLLLRGIGEEIHACNTDHALVNSVRRILAAVREETSRQEEEEEEQQQAVDRKQLSSLLLWTLPQNVSSRPHHVVERHESVASESEVASTVQQQQQYPESYYQRSHQKQQTLQTMILEAVQEMQNELVDMYDAVAAQVPHHIRTGDVVLVCGGIRPPLAHFLAAIPTQTTLLVVADDDPPPLPLPHPTMVPIPLTHAVAVAPRVHTTLVSAHAVLANGGILSGAGAALVVAAAAVTICVTGMEDALCPHYPHEGQDTLQELLGSSSHTASTNESSSAVVDVQPRYDYIPPEHIDVFVTNVGSFPPSFIYRLLAENYHSDDWKLFR